MGRDVRVGVLGLRRGAALARLARQAGMRVVALTPCSWPTTSTSTPRSRSAPLERGLSALS